MKIKIIGFIIDKTQLTMYLEDGSTNTDIKQGDVRLAEIVAKATADLIRNKEETGEQYAIVDLDFGKEENAYEHFEKKSSLVKFFKVAKAKLKELFAPLLPDQVVGTIPEPTDPDTCQLVTKETPIEQTMDKIAEVMKHATPVSSDKFHTKDVYKQSNVVEKGASHTDSSTDDSNEKQTVIAVVDTPQGKKVIPEMERIESQFKHAVKRNNPVGMENFLKRIAPVIEKRGHSVQDLLKFIERNDMPIADDGCFIAYKVLNLKGDGFVDVHSGKVTQWLGSYVHMKESMVDANRSQECSHGLHIARRGYVGGFSGGACALCKVPPENVIAVPHGDGNKIRVMGYHIVELLTSEEFSKVKHNSSFTVDGSAAKKLANVVAGRHIGRTSDVEIGGPKGTELKVTRNLAVTETKIPEGSLEPMQSLPDQVAEKEAAKPVDIKEVLAKQEQIVEQVSTSRKERAQQLYKDWEDNRTEETWNTLNAFKKASKSSWEKLGIPNPDPKPARNSSKVVPVKAEAPKAKPKKVDKIFKKLGKNLKDIVEQQAPKEKPANSVRMSPKEEMAMLLSHVLTPEVAKQILAVKKAAKKSWEYFGLNGDDAARFLQRSKE